MSFSYDKHIKRFLKQPLNYWISSINISRLSKDLLPRSAIGCKYVTRTCARAGRAHTYMSIAYNTCSWHEENLLMFNFINLNKGFMKTFRSFCNKINLEFCVCDRNPYIICLYNAFSPLIVYFVWNVLCEKFEI